MGVEGFRFGVLSHNHGFDDGSTDKNNPGTQNSSGKYTKKRITVRYDKENQHLSKKRKCLKKVAG